MKHHVEGRVVSSDLLTRRQAAEYLGVSENTLAVWKCTGRHDLPCIKVGRLVRYRLADLEAFIDRNRVAREVA